MGDSHDVPALMVWHSSAIDGGGGDPEFFHRMWEGKTDGREQVDEGPPVAEGGDQEEEAGDDFGDDFDEFNEGCNDDDDDDFGDFDEADDTAPTPAPEPTARQPTHAQQPFLADLVSQHSSHNSPSNC